MEKIFKIFNKEYSNINQAAFLLGLFAIFSQILGLFRDRALAHFIGPSKLLDSYYAAFRIPDFIFISIASVVSVTVLIPFILNLMKDGVITDQAKKFLNDIFSLFFIVIISISVIVFIFMPFIVGFIAPGFDLDSQQRVVILSRIMLLSPIFLGFSNLFSTITQIFHKFFIYSLSPIFYNLGIIFGVLFLYPFWGIYGVAIGVVFGAFMHFLIQAFSSFSSGFIPSFSLKINFKEIKNAVIISLPRTLGLSLNNIALIVLVSFASYLYGGSISIFSFSLNLQSVPLGIIGLSYSVAVFPLLTRSYSLNKIDEFKNNLKSTARQIVFWSLPVTFLFIVLRAHIVRVILGSGVFSWENTRLVAASVAVFSISIVAQGLIALFARAYYASGNTKKPLLINLFSSISIVLFSIIFMFLFRNLPQFRYFIESLLKVSDINGTEVLMLPLAYSLGTILNCSLLWLSIKKDFLRKEDFISTSFFQSLGASFFIGFVSYISLNIFSLFFNAITFWGILFQGFISGVLGILVGIIILFMLKNEQLYSLIDTIKSRFWKNNIIPPIQEGL